jgi:hypothetical protein
MHSRTVGEEELSTEHLNEITAADNGGDSRVGGQSSNSGVSEVLESVENY